MLAVPVQAGDTLAGRTSHDDLDVPWQRDCFPSPGPLNPVGQLHADIELITTKRCLQCIATQCAQFLLLVLPSACPAMKVVCARSPTLLIEQTKTNSHIMMSLDEKLPNLQVQSILYIHEQQHVTLWQRQQLYWEGKSIIRNLDTFSSQPRSSSPTHSSFALQRW